MAAFCNILVPLDFTPKNSAALDVVLELARPGITRVTLMHVVEAMPHEADDPLVGFYRSLEENAVQKLKTYGEKLRAGAIEVNDVVSLGRPARRIVAEAQISGVDLIVLSSHPLGSHSREHDTWATVSYQVAVFCRCPVMLVK